MSRSALEVRGDRVADAVTFDLEVRREKMTDVVTFDLEGIG